MDDQLTRLKRRAQILGNHYRKYLHVVDRGYDGLCGRLERKRVVEKIHIWERPFDYRAEMSLVARLGDTLEEKLSDLGCYFALHFLQQNLNALDTMRLDVARTDTRLQVFRTFMLHVGHEVRQLVSGYMAELLKIYLPENFGGKYVFLGVGTRSDQDDIDVGVVDCGPEDRELLTNAIARLNGEMLRKAIVTHYHLSENVCREASFSASIADYNALLHAEIHDFVIINEMLGAARILGSRALYSDFLRQVTSRYYYQPGKPEMHKFHEGYLRGITGEIRSFMFKEFADDRLDPKIDGLRMIKASLFAAKTIFNLRQVNAWALLEALVYHDKRRSLHYHKLEVCLTYLEVFRFLYHLLVSQEDEIYINDPATHSNVAIVADYMGYRKIGSAGSFDFFIADYYNKARLAKWTTRDLLPDVISHLATITTFGRIMHRRKVTLEGETRVGNLARRFLDEAKFFRGTRFWDDIIAVLSHKDRVVLDRLVNDLTADPDATEELLQRYMEWGWNSFIALFSFLNLLHGYPEKRRLHRRLLELFFQRTIGTEMVQRFSVVFQHVPQELHKFLGSLSEEQQRQFQNIIAGELWDSRIVPARNRLSYLASLHYASSRYLKRITDRVLMAQPAVYKMINDPERLQGFGKGLLAEIMRTPGYKDRLEGIAAWHDFEFFRCCLLLLGSAPAEVIADEFIFFSDTFIRLLYDTCKQRVDEKGKHRPMDRPALAVLVTGGYGHMLAFDDDHDLIILLDSEDPEVHAYYVNILKRMHRQIGRCGVLPHYRLADHFGSFICTPAQIKSLLAEDNTERFIDMSQLLGARMIVGTSGVWEMFNREIIHDGVFAQKRCYTEAMLEEIVQRQSGCSNSLAPTPAKAPRPGSTSPLSLPRKLSFPPAHLSLPPRAKGPRPGSTSPLSLPHKLSFPPAHLSLPPRAKGPRPGSTSPLSLPRKLSFPPAHLSLPPRAKAPRPGSTSPLSLPRKLSFPPAHLSVPTLQGGNGQSGQSGLNLKEMPGGLRDVEMLLDIFRAQFELFENSNYRMFKKMEAILPEHAAVLAELYRHYELLRLVRNLNRLAIAADDQVDFDHLHPVIETWRIEALKAETPLALRERILAGAEEGGRDHGRVDRSGGQASMAGWGRIRAAAIQLARSSIMAYISSNAAIAVRFAKLIWKEKLSRRVYRSCTAGNKDIGNQQ